MRKHRTLNSTTFISAIFIFTIILSSCATATPIIPGELPDLEPGPQGQIDVPGGLMTLPDGSGTEHSVLVFDFQIQSRLVTSGEFQECVEAGACEPAPEAIHEYAPAGVSWYQAQAYCSYLGGRLPTEAELTRSTGGSEDCPESGGSLIDQEGFGEWVYDWDDPDFYNGSLVSNPFGPMYGDLKVAMGLDLDLINEVIYKYFGKYEDPETFAKYDGSEISGKVEEEDGSFAKWDDERSFIKIEDLKIFGKVDWSSTKDGWNYSIKVEDGKFFISSDAAGHDKWDPGEGALFPRMGILPDQFNPLVGFRCVTEGAALTYAPICKTETAAKCSLPAEQVETISAQLTMVSGVNPNFQIVGANCPQGEVFDITISHDLTSGDGVEIKAGGKECNCQEFADYPGKLYCECPSPGAGLKTEIDICAAGGETLIAMNDFCPDGSHFDIAKGGCVIASPGTPVVYSMIGDGEESGGSACPSGPGLPVPQYGPLSVAAASVEGIGGSELPDGDQWELFSLSDGSGMCPPGYAYNGETGCCSPYSDENYDCGSGEYFDAGKKQCLPVGWDGCGPCQVLDPEGLCAPKKVGEDMLGGRCNVGNEDEVGRDDLGRSIEPSGDCAEGSYLDPGLGKCLESRDACAHGYYLDPKTGRCRPLSGHESPCTEGYTYSPLTGCCVPSPGTEDSECPKGTEFDGTGCTALVSGCPSTHYFDEESDSCLLREPAECPGGTTKNMIGKCIPDIPEVCPDGTEFYPTSGSCPSGPPDPALCTGDKVFDASVGYCVTGPSNTRRRGDAVVEDVVTVEEEGAAPKLGEGALLREYDVMPVISTVVIPEGVFRCLMLTADKTFRSGQGLCRPQGEGDGTSEDFFTVDFEEGKVSKITRVSPDTIEPAEANEPPREDVVTCNIDYVLGAAPDTGSEPDDDDWSEPVSGTLPPVGACTPNIFIDAGSIFAPENCTTFSTTVPICAAPSTSGGGGGNICIGIPNQTTCSKTTGCGWGASCVKCSSETDQGTCGNLDGCHWDINANKCVDGN